MERKEPENKLLEASQLLDFYGRLLTERQRRFMSLHFEEDLSFSEIAREYSISRQAVHDSVKHAIQTLENIEEALGLVAKAREEAEAPCDGFIGGRQLLQRLRDLRDQVRRRQGKQGEWVARELEHLLELLEGRSIREEAGNF